MKLLVALCTILTFQLCLIRASELEEHDVEDQDMEMEEDQDMEMEDDIIDSNAIDLQARHRDKHICEKNRKEGYGGECIPNKNLCGHSGCDYLWNDTINPSGHVTYICPDDECCCVNCNSEKMQGRCGKTSPNLMATRKCCPGWRQTKPLPNECLCCKKCKPSPRWCRGGFCVTLKDPICNNNNCTANDGILYLNKRCTGTGCSCCGPPTPPTEKYEAFKKMCPNP